MDAMAPTAKASNVELQITNASKLFGNATIIVTLARRSRRSSARKSTSAGAKQRAISFARRLHEKIGAVSDTASKIAPQFNLLPSTESGIYA